MYAQIRPRLQRQEASPDLRDPPNQVRRYVLRRAHLQASLQYPNGHCRRERRPRRKPRQFCPDVSSFGPGQCTSVDDVFSSSSDPFLQADELAAFVGSAGRTSSTVGSVPDHSGSGIGDMAGGGQGGGTGSFPSSPSSLGFVVGSLGSIGNDDFFLFDP